MKARNSLDGRRFIFERFSVDDRPARSGRASGKQLGLAVRTRQWGIIDRAVLDARLRRRFMALATSVLRSDGWASPVIERVAIEQAGTRVTAWVFGSVNSLEPADLTSTLAVLNADVKVLAENTAVPRVVC